MRHDLCAPDAPRPPPPGCPPASRRSRSCSFWCASSSCRSASPTGKSTSLLMSLVKSFSPSSLRLHCRASMWSTRGALRRRCSE
eukprot:scaffold59927_cov54-Phaeocystis_antarctica.AAC.2